MSKSKQYRYALEIARSVIVNSGHYRSIGGKGITKFSAALHYVNEGWKQNLDLSPYFSSEFYNRMNPDVASSGVPPLLHFLRIGGAELRECHPDFNKSEALRQLESLGIKPENYLEQSIRQVKKGRLSIHAIFSFASHNYTANEKEVVKKSGLFDEQYYLNQYPDIVHAIADAFTHYLEFGWKEDRNPSNQFDSHWYKTQYNEDLDNKCPILHLIKHKEKNDSCCIAPNSVELTSNQSNILSNHSAAIHVHLYYPDILDELIPLFEQLDKSIDLYFTTVSKHKLTRIHNKIKKAKIIQSISVKLVPNIGRDIAPMLIGLGTNLKEYDFVCHLHSKKSPHTHFGDRWRNYLFDQLVGSQTQVNRILSTLYGDRSLGLLYPDNYFEIKKFTGWNGNYDAAAELFEKFGLDAELLPSDPIDFPAGSMCWFKPKSIFQLFDGNISIEDFQIEDSQEEGTVAHVVERCLGVLPKFNGFSSKKFYGEIVNIERYANAWDLNSFDVGLQNSRYNVDSRWLRDTPNIALNERVELNPQYPYYNSESLNIHWIIPDFGIGAGGHMTIFRMVKYLEEFGHRQTIWIQNARNYATPKMAKETINLHYQAIDEGVIVQFLPEDVKWISGDVVIATDCWTVFPILAMSRFKERFYFIQDWEPMFHAVGDSHLIAKLTYSFGLNALCAGEWLFSKAQEEGMWARKWNLATDRKFYFPANTDVKTNKETSDILHVAFYARAYTPRRAVMLGVAALKELDKRGVKLHVSFFGQDGLNFGVSFSHEYLGIISAEELGDLYRQSDVGMVFSATNYSLIPLEMMACALPVLELDVESTRAVFDTTFVDLVNPDPLAIANRLEQLAKDPNSIKKKSQFALDFANSLSWKQSARDIESAILEKLTDTNFIPVTKKQLFPANKTYELKSSVIIPTYNAGPSFKKVIDIILNQETEFDFEVVVVDSGSSDETVDILNAVNDKRLKLYSIPNTDFQHGRTRNYAISLCKGEFIAVLTQDAMPANENWLSNLLAGLEYSDTSAGVFGAHRAYKEHSPFVKRDIDRVFERFDMLGDSYDWYFDKVEPGSIEWQHALQFYSDNNSCMRKSAWEHVPYPEIDWGEDQAWAWMMIQLGFTKTYSQNSIVYHSHDDTPESRFKTARAEAAFFNASFGFTLIDQNKKLKDLIKEEKEKEQYYGNHHNFEAKVISTQLSLVEACMRGRASVLTDDDDIRIELTQS